MERDLNLIRSMLLEIEAGGPIEASDETERYHLILMGQGRGQAGFIDDRGHLTIRGWEIIELCRDQERWQRALDGVHAASGGHNFELIEAWLRRAA